MELQSGPIDWKTVAALLPHRTAVVVRNRYCSMSRHSPASMTYGKASSFPEETLRRQQLLRGFFFRHRVPVNHPYWADLLGADVGPVIRRLPVTDADGGAAEENPLVMMTASSTGASFCIFFFHSIFICIENVDAFFGGQRRAQTMKLFTWS